jgi:hypothetical protein
MLQDFFRFTLRLLIVASVVFNSFTDSSMSSSTSTKITGSSDFKYIYYKNHTLYTESAVNIPIKSSDEFDVGCVIGLQVKDNDAVSGNFSGSYIFLGHKNIGKFELGSTSDAASKMCITGHTITPGSNYLHKFDIIGDGFDRYIFLIDEISQSTAIHKFSYYSPNAPLMIGASIIPDKKFSEDSSHSISNAFAGGLSLQSMLTDEVALKISFTGEKGSLADSKFWNYNIGSIISYVNYSVAASYGRSSTKTDINQQDEITKKKQEEKDVYYYSAAASYEQGPADVGICVTRTTNNHNKKLNTFTLGSSFQIDKALRPYFEVSYLHANSLKNSYNFVLGLNLKF